MPSKDVAAADLHLEIERLEQKNRITSVVPAGDGAYVVVYEPRAKRATPGDKETR